MITARQFGMLRRGVSLARKFKFRPVRGARLLTTNPVMSRRAFLKLGLTAAAQATGVKLASGRIARQAYTPHGLDLLRAAARKRRTGMARAGMMLLGQIGGALG